MNALTDRSGNEYHFETKEELLEIPYVKQFTNVWGFARFSKSESMLMIELDSGYKWYVIGYLLFPNLIDLPQWVKK